MPRDRSYLHRGRRAAVIILEPYNVVFPKITAALDLNQDQGLTPRIRNTMGCTKRHIHGPAYLDRDLLPLQRHTGCALDDHPVLGALGMLLVAQPFPGEYF